jgi:formylmethanofuran dehydrogenase subunit E
VRVLFHGKGIPATIQDDRKAKAQFILEAPADNILSCSEVTIDEPLPARIHKSVTCDICGEKVMETRIRDLEGKLVCIPCAGKKG